MILFVVAGLAVGYWTTLWILATIEEKKEGKICTKLLQKTSNENRN